MANVLNQYGNGVNSTTGANNVLMYYKKTGIEAAVNKEVLAQFVCAKEVIPNNCGREFRIKRFFNSYDRAFKSADWLKNGWLSNRDIFSVSQAIDMAILPEAAGKQNQLTLETATLKCQPEEFGAMIEYTDRVEGLSEDAGWINRFYRALGYWCGQTNEDQILLDMLSSPSRIYSGIATDITEVGAGTLVDGSTDQLSLPSYDLFRMVEKKLTSYRAEKNTRIVVGTDKVNTNVVGAAYYATIGADSKYDLQTIVNPHDKDNLAWLPIEKYGAAAKLAKNEVGALYRTGVRFVELERMVVYKGGGAPLPIDEATGEYLDAGGYPLYSGNLQYSTFGSVQDVIAARGKVAYIHGVGGTYTVEEGTTVPADGGGETFVPILSYFNVHPIIFPTQDSYATVGLRGANAIKWLRKSPSESADIDNNPYGTRGFISARFWHGGLILRQENLFIVFTAASNS